MVFDCHVHGPAENGTFWQWHPVTRDAGDMVRYLRDCGVTRVVVSCAGSQRSRTAEDLVIGNDIAYRLSGDPPGRVPSRAGWAPACGRGREAKGKASSEVSPPRQAPAGQEKRSFPGFVTPACLVNPNFLEASLAELERAAARGVCWVGELCGYIAGYPFTSPTGGATAQFAEIVARASALGMVLHLHAGTEEMGRLADAYPRARFVIAHIGDSAQHCAERIDMVASHPNVHMDISGAGSERVGILELAVTRIGADRVLFGSDFTINDPGTVLARIQRAYLTDAEREKVLHENVARLLGP